MKEIDTESSVTWPSWCYTDKINCDVLKEYSEVEKVFDDNFHKDCNSKSIKVIKPTSARTSLSLPRTTNVGEEKMLSERSLLLSGYINNNTKESSAKTNCDIHCTPPLSAVPLSVQSTGLTITPTTTAAAAAAYLYLEKVKNERMSPRVTAAQIDSLKDAIMESSAAAAVAAAMVNNNNSISNNNNDSSHNSSASNNKINSSSSGSNCSNNNSSINNNLVSSQVQNQIANNTSDELHSQTLTITCNQLQQSQEQQQQQQQQQQHLQKQSHHHQQQHQHSLHMNSNNVKKERLSPGTNGDLQTTLSRSRSTTPSSFRGASPQNSVHNSPSDTLVPMHNLSTNLLNSIHQAATSSRHGNLGVSSPGITNSSSGLPTEFSTRNYSDFMRSLAAKYNNTNPNDSNLKRSALFEAASNNSTGPKKASIAAQKTSYATSPSTPLNKEVTITTTSSLPPPPPLTSVAISPGESASKLSQQNKLAAAVANAAAACSSNNVSPYMTSFLTSLPFSPGIFPPLIDMSSTQALITLARAAKENEIHNILSASSTHAKRSAANTSPSTSPSLNMALQQAAQFISPALIYSAQLQKQQLHQQQQQHEQQSQASRQSSPHLANISNSTSSSTTSAKSLRNLGEKANISPLDLSSQPPATKRFKAESTSSQSSIDGQMHTTITRRASSSTATTSPSPPPIYEKFLNTSPTTASTTAATSVSIAAVVGSSSKSEATTTAFMPIKVASSTSATSSIAPAVTVRQCQAQSEELNSWTVNDVCAFVGSIDICAEYVQHFRDQCIDGSGLPLLTEDHLVNSLGMKLGPALKLRSVLAKKLGGPCPCVSCVAQIQQFLALQTSGMTTAKTKPTTDHSKTIDTVNVAAICSNDTISSGSCVGHLQKKSSSANNSLSCSSSYNSSINSSSVNKNESTTTTSINIISPNSTTANVCNNEENLSNTPRSNSNSNANVGNFSSPPAPPPPAIPTPQHHLHRHQQKSPPLNICSSNSNDSTTDNRHDNADSNS